MINKQGIWFLTLTSLALVLSVYYITMPNELLLTNNSNFKTENNTVDTVSNENVTIKDSELITSMRVELDNERTTLMSDKNLTVDEKNEVYEDLRYLSNIASLEETLERKIKDEFKLNSFVKIDGDIVEVTISASNHDKTLVVNIMKSLQEEFTEKKYISISFKDN